MSQPIEGEFISKRQAGHIPKQRREKLLRGLIERIHKQDIIMLGAEKSRLRLAMEKVFDEAAKGSLAHLSFIADRVDGKPAQEVGIGQAEDMEPLVGQTLLNAQFEVLLAKVDAVKKLTHKE